MRAMRPSSWVAVSFCVRCTAFAPSRSTRTHLLCVTRSRPPSWTAAADRSRMRPTRCQRVRGSISLSVRPNFLSSREQSTRPSFRRSASVPVMRFGCDAMA